MGFYTSVYLIKEAREGDKVEGEMFLSEGESIKYSHIYQTNVNTPVVEFHERRQGFVEFKELEGFLARNVQSRQALAGWGALEGIYFCEMTWCTLDNSNSGFAIPVRPKIKLVEAPLTALYQLSLEAGTLK